MTILVTGATGRIGRKLIAELDAAGEQVRAVTRQDAAAAGLGNVEVVTDVTRLKDVTAIFVHPRAIQDHVSDLLTRAREAGVERAVALSAVNVDEPLEQQPSRVRGDRNREVEYAVRNSGLDAVILRCEVFMSNTFGTIAPQLRRGDVVRWPFPGAREAMVDERDISEVAAHILRRGRSGESVLELTGPSAPTLSERVATIGRATGRALRVELAPPEAAVAAMMSVGLPDAFARGFLAQQEKSVQKAPRLGDGIPRILDRPATSFADWAARHAEVFT